MHEVTSCTQFGHGLTLGSQISSLNNQAGLNLALPTKLFLSRNHPLYLNYNLMFFFLIYKEQQQQQSELFYDLETSPKWDFPMKH